MALRYAAVDDDLPRIFQGISILPTKNSERLRNKATSEGERKLLFAVLEDAILGYLQDAGEASLGNTPEFHGAAEWLSSDDESGPFAFLRVCEALGIDAGRLRSGLLNHIDRLKADSAYRSSEH
jgi:hypothetical protein